MATQFDPIAKDQSINTTESPSRNIADVLAQELSGISTALTTASNTKLHLFNKLWENPSPSSAFSAQTITLASSDYDFLCIFYRSDDIYNSTTIPKGHSATLNDSFAISSNLVARVRYLNRSSDTAYAVTDCTRVSYGSSTTQNDTVIPIAIYGFKKSVDINAIVSSVSTDADKCIMSDGVTNVEQAINAINNFEVTDITYNNAITSGTAVDLDSSKDYRNALAITVLYQDNVSNNVSGIAYAHRNTGHLMFMPSITSATTIIKIRILWLKV